MELAELAHDNSSLQQRVLTLSLQNTNLEATVSRLKSENALLKQRQELLQQVISEADAGHAADRMELERKINELMEQLAAPPPAVSILEKVKESVVF